MSRQLISFSGKNLRIMTQVCRCSVRHHNFCISDVFAEIYLNERACVCRQVFLGARKPNHNVRLVSFEVCHSEDVMCCITSKPERCRKENRENFRPRYVGLSIAAGHQQHCYDEVSHYLPTQTNTW